MSDRATGVAPISPAGDAPDEPEGCSAGSQPPGALGKLLCDKYPARDFPYKIH